MRVPIPSAPSLLLPRRGNPGGSSFKQGKDRKGSTLRLIMKITTLPTPLLLSLSQLTKADELEDVSIPIYKWTNPFPLMEL
jgi:hypothetical protein